MFTGIINHIGFIEQTNLPGIWIKATKLKVKLGDSVSVNGVCLTVKRILRKKQGATLYFEVSNETIEKTTLGDLRKGTRVHLETAMTMKDVFGGHIVQGHVDGVGRVKKIETQGKMRNIYFEAPAALSPYLVSKGSIAIDGVSLTMVGVKKNQFSVALIPFTLDHTNLGLLEKGDPVNMEADIMAKYIRKYLEKK